MDKCYCDASFNPVSRIAVIGWRINNNKIQTMIIKNTNNTRAEIIGLIRLISELEKDKQYMIYTDCMGIINRIASKDVLIHKQYKTANGRILANADLYDQLFGMLTDNIQIQHIKGHLPKDLMNEDNMRFSELDKYVRHKLRSLNK